MLIRDPGLVPVLYRVLRQRLQVTISPDCFTLDAKGENI